MEYSSCHVNRWPPKTAERGFAVPESVPEVPIVAFSGPSDSGKTFFIQRLIPELNRRGYRVATIKHTHHEISFPPDKDTERHIEAGSQAAMLVSPTHLLMIKPLDNGFPISEMAELFRGMCDIIIAEGFKHSNLPKVLVRGNKTDYEFDGLSNVIGTITNKPANGEAGLFSFDDVEAIADLIENRFLKNKQGPQNC